MIRPATVADSSALIRMALAFHAEVPAALKGVPSSILSASRAVAAMLAEADAVVLVLDLEGAACGVLAAQIIQYPLGPARLAREVMFWIDPEARGRWGLAMLAAYEAAARARGAALAGMTCFDDGRTRRLMELAGYAATEINFVKAL